MNGCIEASGKSRPNINNGDFSERGALLRKLLRLFMREVKEIDYARSLSASGHGITVNGCDAPLVILPDDTVIISVSVPADALEEA